MKVYKKSKLTIKDGLVLTKKGKVVALNPIVIELANRLDLDLQKALYLKAQPKAVPAPSLKGFEPKSENMWDNYHVATKTPLHDEEIERSIALMEELDRQTDALELEKYIGIYKDLLEFVSDYSALSHDADPIRINTPELGNLLKLDTKDVLEAIIMAYIDDCSEVEAYRKDVESE